MESYGWYQLEYNRERRVGWGEVNWGLTFSMGGDGKLRAAGHPP